MTSDPSMMLSTPTPLGSLESALSTLESANFRNLEQSKHIAAWVREKYDEMKNARSTLQNTWYMNMSFYYGLQYSEILPRLNRIHTPPALPYRVRSISNRIRPAVRTEIARLTSQKPSASVIPASSEDEDLSAAYAGEQVWEYISYNSKLPRHFRRAAWWMTITGVGFIKTWWDPTVVDGSTGIEGDIQYGSVTPFHLFVPDLREEEIENQPYIINAYTKPVEWVKTFYGDKLDGLNIIPDVVGAQELLNDAYLNIKSGGNTQPDQVLIIEAWIKPGGCEYFPQGGMVQVIADQVVGGSLEGLPYKHGMFPITKFEHIPTGKFYSDSVIGDIMGLQREYNRTRSQIIEAKNRMAKPQLLAAKGSMDVTKWTTEPGQVIEYRPGLQPPTPLPLQPLPAYVLQELDRILMDIEDITGQHQVSRGSAPPGVTAATAISFLQERDDSLLTHTYQSIESGFEDIAKQTLSMVVQYWDIPRTIKVVGTDGYFDVLQLKGVDLKSGTDIRMEGGSALPVSKSARQAFVMDMMKMGFIPPDDGLKMMEIGGVQKLYQKIKADESQAQRENIKMKRMTPEDIMGFQQEFMVVQQQAMQQGEIEMDAQGQPLDMEEPPPIISVNSWDNHGVHVETHNNFRKSQSFELLPEEIKAEFEKHVNMHLMAIQDAMMQVQMFGGDPNNPEGGPGGPPGGNMEEPPGQESGPPPMPGGM